MAGPLEKTGLQVFGIDSCDTCRKARKWLTGQGLDFGWADLRDAGPNQSQVGHWLEQVGAQRLVNRRSTTWRNLDAQQRPVLDSPDLHRPDLVAALLEHPTLIKRPVFERDGQVRAGFDDGVRRWLLQA